MNPTLLASVNLLLGNLFKIRSQQSHVSAYWLQTIMFCSNLFHAIMKASSLLPNCTKSIFLKNSCCSTVWSILWTKSTFALVNMTWLIDAVTCVDTIAQ